MRMQTFYHQIIGIFRKFIDPGLPDRPLTLVLLSGISRQSLLYDFYGELLTQTQKSIYEDVVMNDLSYSELAREYGISRQGVFDMMKRCDKKLEDFEKKLKLVEKFENAREKVATIQTEIQALRESNENPTLDGAFADIDTNLTGLLDDF